MENFVVCVFRSVLVLSDSWRGISHLLPGGCKPCRQALRAKEVGELQVVQCLSVGIQTFTIPPVLTTAVPPSAVLESRESSFWFVLGALFYTTLFSFFSPLIMTLVFSSDLFSFYMKSVFLNSLKEWERTAFLGSQLCSFFFCCFPKALHIQPCDEILLFSPPPSFSLKPLLSSAAFILVLLTLNSIPNSSSSL